MKTVNVSSFSIATLKPLLLLFLMGMLLTSCGSSRTPADRTVIGEKSSTVSNKTIRNVISHARSFEGTRYKFGGTDKRGMDCSGLVYTCFQREKVALPRISRDMAKKGLRISLKDASEGDLLFFQTSKTGRRINHVGLVVEARNGTLHFIHSTTSRGVIVSSLDERYWRNAFVEVRRII